MGPAQRSSLARRSITTASMIRSRDTSVSLPSDSYAAMSRVVIPLAYSEITASSNPASRRPRWE